MPSPKSQPVAGVAQAKDKTVTLRLSSDLWERAQLVCFDEGSTDDPDFQPDPDELNMSKWLRDVIEEYVTAAEAGNPGRLAEKHKAAKRAKLQRQLAELG